MPMRFQKIPWILTTVQRSSLPSIIWRAAESTVLVARDVGTHYLLPNKVRKFSQVLSCVLLLLSTMVTVVVVIMMIQPFGGAELSTTYSACDLQCLYFHWGKIIGLVLKLAPGIVNIRSLKERKTLWLMNEGYTVASVSAIFCLLCQQEKGCY